ncbi:hypothetical protein NPX13_g10458 [Xylaria arbuscula]|uniref:Uncharacterized protein n=1 Tax=Xylaria arbuscula TaxID=114810 RepID=A0A9W8THW9_9PEZI|nr:hypothetical protein NPX13_g10458 [Xylaria arbuscula]
MPTSTESDNSSTRVRGDVEPVPRGGDIGELPFVFHCDEFEELASNRVSSPWSECGDDDDGNNTQNDGQCPEIDPAPVAQVDPAPETPTTTPHIEDEERPRTMTIPIRGGRPQGQPSPIVRQANSSQSPVSVARQPSETVLRLCRPQRQESAEEARIRTARENITHWVREYMTRPAALAQREPTTGRERPSTSSAGQTTSTPPVIPPIPPQVPTTQSSSSPIARSPRPAHFSSPNPPSIFEPPCVFRPANAPGSAQSLSQQGAMYAAEWESNARAAAVYTAYDQGYARGLEAGRAEGSQRTAQRVVLRPNRPRGRGLSG